MAHIVTGTRALPIAKADAGNTEIPAAPETFALGASGFSIPFTAEGCSKIRVWAITGDMAIQQRPTEGQAWTALQTITAGQSAVIDCPVGQLRASAPVGGGSVYVQGVMNR